MCLYFRLMVLACCGIIGVIRITQTAINCVDALYLYSSLWNLMSNQRFIHSTTNNLIQRRSIFNLPFYKVSYIDLFYLNLIHLICSECFFTMIAHQIKKSGWQIFSHDIINIAAIRNTSSNIRSIFLICTLNLISWGYFVNNKQRHFI